MHGIRLQRSHARILFVPDEQEHDGQKDHDDCDQGKKDEDATIFCAHGEESYTVSGLAQGPMIGA